LFRITDSRIDDRLEICLRLVEGFAIFIGLAAEVVNFIPAKYAPDSVRNLLFGHSVGSGTESLHLNDIIHAGILPSVAEVSHLV